MRRWYAEHPGYAANSVRRRREANPDGVRAADMAEYGANRPKHLARMALNSAVRRGIIERPTACERCRGEGAVQGHHDDYAKPLEVRWLCATCHGLEHRAAA